MKNIRLLILASLLSYSFLSMAQSEHHDHNKSNQHMNKRSFADLVDNFEDPSRDEWMMPNEVIAALGDIDGKTIMDIGSGTGYFSFRLAKEGAKVIAADVDDRFLEFIEKKKKEVSETNITTRKVPYESPNLGNEEADAVIIVNTYHHIDNRVAYFGKVLNGIKPGGQCMVVDFRKMDAPYGPPKDHKVAKDIVAEELNSAGFSSIEVDITTMPYHYIITATK